ncbi:MAG: glycosyltransferase family 2 protein [Burkholderiales bacterium]
MSICALVISYYPSVEIIGNVTALLDQVDEIIVVDNGSGAETKILLEKLADYSNVQVIYNQDNLGIAAALNIGIGHAKAIGHQWVATFDQDSKVTPEMVKTMLLAYDAYPEKEKVWGLSPRYQNQSTGQISTSRSNKTYVDNLPYAEVLVVMTSGNLIKTSVFDVVGYFNESLFIDHVDSEFCLRCSNLGYKILEVNDAILLHCIGFPVQHKILWKIKTTSNHSSLRRYYIARNGIYIYKKFIFIYPAWVIHDAYKFLKLMIMLVLFETDKKQKLSAIFKGILHGLSGKMGKFNGSM